MRYSGELRIAKKFRFRRKINKHTEFYFLFFCDDHQCLLRRIKIDNNQLQISLSICIYLKSIYIINSLTTVYNYKTI